MKKRLAQLFLVFGLSLVLAHTVNTSIVLARERPAPDFALTAMDEATYRLEDFQGQPVVILFFTTWCPFCTQEMPVLEEFYQELSDKEGLMVFAINVQETVNDVKKMLDSMNISYPVLLDQTGRVATSYRMVALPTTYFIDPRGNLRDMVIGAANKRVLQEKMNHIIWYRGLDETELAALVPMITDLHVLDFRNERENPFPEVNTLRYHEVRDLEVALSHFSPEGVFLLLTDEEYQSVVIAREMALAGFSRIYYRIADDREG